MNIAVMWGKFRDGALQWRRGKKWYAYFPFLIWFAYVFFRHLTDPGYNSILGPLNLGIHEFGHLIFFPFGQFLSVLGGTLFQLFVPIYGVVNFYRQKNFFAIALCFGWLSTSFFDIARYVADARAMNLPLAAIFGNENVIHDWNYLLGRLGILRFDAIAAFFIRCLAVISMLVCFALGAWLLWQIKKHSLIEK